MVLILMVVVTPLSTLASVPDQSHCGSMHAMALAAESLDVATEVNPTGTSECCDFHDCANCQAPCSAQFTFLLFRMMTLAEALVSSERFDAVVVYVIVHPPNDLLRPPIPLLS